MLYSEQISTRTAMIQLALAFVLYRSTLASNWAQLSGDERQQMTTTQPSGFTARFGAATTVVERPEPELGEQLPDIEVTRLILFGGDDYSVEAGQGSYRNDYWYTIGPQTEAVNSLVESTHTGRRMPRVVSRLQWRQLAGDRTPPSGIGYREWLCCLSAARFRCQDVSCEPIDPYQGTRRFSPRRDHVAVTLDASRVLVMGGRARALEDVPPEQSVGGIVGERGRWRELTILTSDTWMWTPQTDTWELINPGCYVPQEDLTLFPGTKEQQCRSNVDCEDKRLGRASCVRGACVCDLWSPRERFSAAVSGEAVFVVGGMTHVQTHMCGPFACGDGYTRVLDDVWRSDDGGVLWEQLVGAGSAPYAARAEFGLALVQSTLILMGGRGGEAPSVYEDSPLLNDVWRSQDGGLTWTIDAELSGGFEPTSAFQTVVAQGVVYIIGGLTNAPPDPAAAVLSAAEELEAAGRQVPAAVLVDQPDDDPMQKDFTDASGGSWLVGFGKQQEVAGKQLRPTDAVYSADIVTALETGDSTGLLWRRDFEQGTPQEDYFSENQTAISKLNLTAGEARALASEGIVTVRDLALASGDSIRRLRDPNHFDRWPHADGGEREVCLYKELAEVLMDRCQVRERPYEGEFMLSLFVVEGSEATDRIAAYGGYWIFGEQHERPVENAETRQRAAEELAAAAAADQAGSTALFTGDTPQVDPAELKGGLDGCGDRAKLMQARIEAEYEADANGTNPVCRQAPAPRFSSVATSFKGDVMVATGYEGQSRLGEDLWVRDDELPATAITASPRTGSPDTVFDFSASEDACVFEWRAFFAEDFGGVISLGTGREVRNWSRVLPRLDVSDFMERGWFRLEVRAIDPAGNRDPLQLLGTNVHVWRYVPPIPWLFIILGIVLFVLLVIGAVYYYRRWRRQQALERYAMKRIQRKLKAVQEGDWRKFYGKKKKKKKKGKKGRKKKKGKKAERERRKKSKSKSSRKGK